LDIFGNRKEQDGEKTGQNPLFRLVQSLLTLQILMGSDTFSYIIRYFFFISSLPESSAMLPWYWIAPLLMT
jgi:hypothetical protein